MEQKKRKAIVVAQIGRGTYKEIDYGKVQKRDQVKEGQKELYINSDETYRFGYSFGAVCDQLRKKVKELDDEIEVLLIGTETSYWGNLCAYYKYDKSDISADKLLEMQKLIKGNASDWNLELKSDDKKGIKIPEIDKYAVCVTDFLNNCNNQKTKDIKYSVVIIKDGVIEEQIKENFTVLRKKIENIIEYTTADEYELCFDISMGYRSIPMYVYNFVNFLAKTKLKKDYRLHIYYGMEASSAENIEHKEDEVPIVDLNSIKQLTEWIGVVNEFNEYGSVRGLVRMLESADEEESEDVNETIKEERKKLADMFSMFDYASNANNLVLLERAL
ncbi:MAG: TM1812 family CRISPR-associated protein [Lachnospiraceae bacterium]|nr:TM1812 family CRISPR-associated protein [Lachnospiraceae bacterium]